MDNVRVRILMTGVVALILAVTIGTMIRRFRPREGAQYASATVGLQTTMRQWCDALQLALSCPWIVALPFVIGAIEVAASCLWTHHLWPDGGIAARDLPNLAELVQGFRRFHLEQAAHLALKAGSIHVGVMWTGAVVLVVGIWALAKRRASALTWLVWAVLITGLAAPAWFTIARMTNPRGMAGHWAHTVVSLLAHMGVAALVGGLILLALRRATRQQPVSEVSIVDELARFWPEWFLLAFLMALPSSVFVLVATLATSDSIPAETRSWLMAMAQNEWVRGGAMWTASLLALAFRFAPYALAAKACSAGEAARDSLRMWRNSAPEVLRLLAPLWCLGVVVYAVLLLCPSGPNRFLSPFTLVGLIAHTLAWLGRSLTVAFFLFAEIVCLGWYQSVTGLAPDYHTCAGESNSEPRLNGRVDVPA